MADTMTMSDEQVSATFLSAEDIREFQRLVHDTTGRWLDDDTASRRANQLLYLTRALIGQLPEEATFEGSNVVQS